MGLSGVGPLNLVSEVYGIPALTISGLDSGGSCGFWSVGSAATVLRRRAIALESSLVVSTMTSAVCFKQRWLLIGRSKNTLVDGEVGKKDIHTQYNGDSVRVRTNTVSC